VDIVEGKYGRNLVEIWPIGRNREIDIGGYWILMDNLSRFFGIGGKYNRNMVEIWPVGRNIKK
jgi:hypothetical protein